MDEISGKKLRMILIPVLLGLITIFFLKLFSIEISFWVWIILFVAIIVVIIISIQTSTPAIPSTPTIPTLTHTPTTQTPVSQSRIWTVIKIAGIIIAIAIILFLLYGPMLGWIKINPYGDGFVAKSQTFSYRTEGNIMGESGGPDWKSFTAGKGGVRGELYLSDVNVGGCEKISFYANKKGGKVKMTFRPYEGSPSYRDGYEIGIGEKKNTANLCYMVNAKKAQAQAVALFDIPEGVTATFLK